MLFHKNLSKADIRKVKEGLHFLTGISELLPELLPKPNLTSSKKQIPPEAGIEFNPAIGGSFSYWVFNVPETDIQNPIFGSPVIRNPFLQYQDNASKAVCTDHFRNFFSCFSVAYGKRAARCSRRRA